MLSCDICGETLSSEPDMKTHLLIVHMENEVICPFCKLSGINYDEMNFHIETAHFEQDTQERNFERLNVMHYRSSENNDSTLQCRIEANSSIHSACASNHPKKSTQNLCEDGALKHEEFYSENLTKSTKRVRSEEGEPSMPRTKGSVYETVYGTPECPFCGKIEDCSQDMETHVKTNHADLLDASFEGTTFILLGIISKVSVFNMWFPGIWFVYHITADVCVCMKVDLFIYLNSRVTKKSLPSAKASRTVLKSCGKRGHPCLVVDLSENASNISSLSMILWVPHTSP